MERRPLEVIGIVWADWLRSERPRSDYPSALATADTYKLKASLRLAQTLERSDLLAVTNIIYPLAYEFARSAEVVRQDSTDAATG
jgi:hypothetical protein